MNTFSLTDHEAPNITCPVVKTVNTKPSLKFAEVKWTDLEAADNARHSPTITCNASRFEIGKNDVICEARDESGNKATCLLTVDVQGNTIFILQLHVKAQFIHVLFVIKIELEIRNGT